MPSLTWVRAVNFIQWGYPLALNPRVRYQIVYQPDSTYLANRLVPGLGQITSLGQFATLPEAQLACQNDTGANYANP